MKAIPIFLYKVVNAFVSGLQSKSVMVATTFFEMLSRGRCWNKMVSNDSLVILPFCSIVFFLLSCIYMKTNQAKSNHFLFLNSKHGVVNLQKNSFFQDILEGLITGGIEQVLCEGCC